MPYYQYTCETCIHSFEGLHKYADAVACPECDSFNTHKVPSGFGGYREISNNDASARPRTAGYKSKKPRNVSER